MRNGVSPLVYWPPRVLSVLFVLFLSLFSFDVVTPGESAGRIALGFIIHNIPTFVMLVITVLAWRYEIIGAVGFILAGFFYTGMILYNGVAAGLALSWSLTISGPAILTGILYLVNWLKKRQGGTLASA